MLLSLALLAAYKRFDRVTHQWNLQRLVQVILRDNIMAFVM